MAASVWKECLKFNKVELISSCLPSLLYSFLNAVMFSFACLSMPFLIICICFYWYLLLFVFAKIHVIAIFSPQAAGVLCDTLQTSLFSANRDVNTSQCTVHTLRLRAFFLYLTQDLWILRPTRASFSLWLSSACSSYIMMRGHSATSSRQHNEEQSCFKLTE